MSSSNQNEPLNTSASTVLNSSVNDIDTLLHLGFTKLNKYYKCLKCNKRYGIKINFDDLVAQCENHLNLLHKNLKGKQLNYWKSQESKIKIKRTPNLNTNDILVGICLTIGKTWYPPNVYNDLIKNIFKISGQTNSILMKASDRDIKTGIDRMESNLEQQIIDYVKTAKYFYFKLLTVEGKHFIFVNFFADDKLNEELFFVENKTNDGENFFQFINKNQINIEKCLGICYYNSSKWIAHIKSGFHNSLIKLYKIKLNIYDIVADITMSDFFSSLVTRINEFKSIESNFALLQTDLTDLECEILKNTDHDWLNISKILRNYLKFRKLFTSNNSNFGVGTLSGAEIVYCAFFCDVCASLEKFRNDCNKANCPMNIKYDIKKLVETFECDARSMRSEPPNFGIGRFSNLNTVLKDEGFQLTPQQKSTFKDCLNEVSNNCKPNNFNDTQLDWIMDPFAADTHLSIYPELSYLLINLRSDGELEKQFKAIKIKSTSNILKFWYNIDLKHEHLQKLALEKLLVEYNTNIYDKLIKLSLEFKPPKIEDWYLRVKLSQLKPKIDKIIENQTPDESMDVSECG